jgi:hypothetical protein
MIIRAGIVNDMAESDPELITERFELTVLCRPVGPKELKLIAESGYRAFPPRRPEQPIFYLY